MSGRRSSYALSQLRRAGFTATPTHFSPTGFKTDADFNGAAEALLAALDD